METLISRHFDQANSADDHALLAAEIERDPAAARDFVRIARMEALLERKLGPAQPVPKPRWYARRTWAIAAIATTAIAACVILHLSFGPTGSHGKRTVLPDPAGANPSNPAAEESLEEIFRRYHVHAEFRNKTAEEILAMLPELIQRENYTGLSQLEGLKFGFVPKAPPFGLEMPPLSQSTSSLPVDYLLRWCGVGGQLTVSNARATMEYLMNQPSSKGFPTIVENQSYAMPALWLEKYFSPGRPNVGIREILELHGIRFPTAQCTASYNPVNREISIKNTRVELHVADHIMGVLGVLEPKWPFLQVRLLAHPFSLPRNHPLFEKIRDHGAMVTRAEFQELRRTLTKSGRETLELPMKEHLDEKSQLMYSRGPTDANQWWGLRSSFTHRLAGEVITVEGSMDFRLLPGETIKDLLNAEFPAKATPSSPATVLHSTEFFLAIPPEQVALFSLDVPAPPGCLAVCGWSGQIIDPFGSLMFTKPILNLRGATIQCQKEAVTRSDREYRGSVTLKNTGIEFQADSLLLKLDKPQNERGRRLSNAVIPFPIEETVTAEATGSEGHPVTLTFEDGGLTWKCRADSIAWDNQRNSLTLKGHAHVEQDGEIVRDSADPEVFFSYRLANQEWSEARKLNKWGW